MTAGGREEGGAGERGNTVKKGGADGHRSEEERSGAEGGREEPIEEAGEGKGKRGHNWPGGQNVHIQQYFYCNVNLEYTHRNFRQTLRGFSPFQCRLWQTWGRRLGFRASRKSGPPPGSSPPRPGTCMPGSQFSS